MFKKLDLFIIRSFVPPLAATFFVSLTVLLLQFLWKYIEDLAGKGLEWYVIMEFLTYSTANLIPLALPLAVLLASIMTFGNLGERYELVSIKSAGVSLLRAFLPLVIIVIFISYAAFLFAIKVIPVANLKWGALYYDLMNQKPAFELKEGIFYNDIENYSIKIASKSKDGKHVQDVIIYDHTLDKGNVIVITAESGEIIQSPDKRYLYFTLFNGRRFEEMIGQEDYYNRLPYNEMTFEKHQIIFDLSEFLLSRTKEDLFRDFWKFKNMNELAQGRDSLINRSALKTVEFMNYYNRYYHIQDTAIYPEKREAVYYDWNPERLLQGKQRSAIISQALLNARTVKSQIEVAENEITSLDTLRAKHEVAWHQKITLSVACFVLFLTGAPLGAIVRKGGFGLPVVFAIIFFIIFFLLNMNGEKLVRQLIIPAQTGMWLANFVLTPIGLWFTYKATRDSALFDMDAYSRFFRRFKRKN